MPHKINPIMFENAEGNFGLANAVFGFFSAKLPISRFQRDLSDSTVMRNIGVSFAYSSQAYSSLLNGLSRLDANEELIVKELDSHYELLAEPIQTVMRKYKIENPYEKLKEFTRGKQVTKEDFETFINSLELPKEIIEDMLKLKPSNYIGLAVKFAENAK